MGPATRQLTSALPCLLMLLAGCAERHAVLVMERSVAAHERGDHVLAARGYREALRLDPLARGAYQNLSLLADVAKRAEDALALARQEHAGHADAGAPMHNLAVLYARRGDVSGVQETLSPATDGTAALIRAEAARRAGQHARAKALAMEVLADAGAPVAERALVIPQARRVLIWASARLGAWDVVLQELEFLAELQTPIERRLHAQALVQLGRCSDALALLAALGGATAVVMRAGCLLSLDRGQEAHAALSALAPADVDDGTRVVLHHLMARHHARVGEWAEALTALDAALAVPGAVRQGVRLDRALVLAHLGRRGEARDVVQGVLEDESTNARARDLAKVLNGADGPE